MHRYLMALVFTTLTLPLASCAHDRSQTTLYEDLGGQSTIVAVVDNFLYRIADDTEMVGFFANTNIDFFAASLASKLCEVSDGPCRYVGPPMDRAHQNMGLTDMHFNRLVEHLDAAMLEEGIALGTRNQLLGRLAPLYADVMRLQ